MSRPLNHAAMSDPHLNRHFVRDWDAPPSLNLHAIERQAARFASLHWLDQAATATGKRRKACFETADRIREAVGLSWSQIMAQGGAETPPGAS